MKEYIYMKEYVHEDEIDHVMHNRQEIQQLYKCPVCGDLQVISNVVFHTRSIEDHSHLAIAPPPTQSDKED